MDLQTRPTVPPGCHPIETGRYHIATRAINELGTDLLKWIRQRVPGGIITGRPRLGKTKAVEFLADQLPGKLQDKIAIYIVTCNSYRNAHEKTFYSDILVDLGHDVVSGQANTLRERICNFLIAAAQDSNQGRVILIFDESQNWDRLQYRWLMDIHNNLSRHGVNLTVFLVGQPELRHKKLSLVAEGMQQIVGRFMVHEHNFHGARSLEDVQACLTCYDEKSEYPLGSGWSYTRFFFPDQFAHGFRLSTFAKDLWEVFENAHMKAGISGSVEIPMQYLAIAIEYALTEFGVSGKDVRTFNKKLWEEALEQSGYVMGEKILVHTGPAKQGKSTAKKGGE